MQTNASSNASSSWSDLILMVTTLRESAAFTYFVFSCILLVYLVTVAGNSVLCLVIYRDPNLHKPMYLLMALLSATDLVEATNSLPRIMSNLVAWNYMSLSECIAQMFFLHVTVRTQGYILAIMALDRYAAIVHPLRYHSVMSNSRVFKAFLLSVAVAGVPIFGYVVVAMRLNYCKERVTVAPNCDFLVLSNLSCGDLSLNVALTYANVLSGVALPFCVVALTYALILRECRRPTLRHAQAKARHTCVTHLLVICVYFGSIFFTIASGLQVFSGVPWQVKSPFQALQYVLPPALNPVVYGLRTAQIRRGLVRACAARVASATA